jgi:hypothetical protein
MKRAFWLILLGFAVVAGLFFMVRARNPSGGSISTGATGAVASHAAANDSGEASALEVHVTAGGAPVAGAHVVVQSRADDPGFPVELVSGRDGAARANGLRTGSHELSVSHADYARLRRQIEIGAGLTRLDLALERGVRIVAEVRDRSGRAIGGAVVRALATESTEEFAAVNSDAQGRAALDRLPLRSYRLYAQSARHRPKYSRTIAFGRHGDEERIVVELEDGKTLSGRVLTQTGEPIEAASIGASGEATLLVKSDRDGRFELGGLGEEPVNVFASAEGFGPTHLRGVRPGTTGLELVLGRAARLGASISFDGARPRVLRAGVCRFDDHFKKELCSAAKLYEPAEDRVEFDGLAAGNYDLVLEAEGFVTTRVKVELEPGGSKEISARITRAR